jgi:spore coat polysaccharide biosynthesis protein SpsF
MIIVQARMGSSRLPGKVLAELGGRPLLHVLIERLQGSRLAGDVLVATTDLAEDEPVVELTRACGANVFRGHPTDVLTRFRDAVRAFDVDLVVRISADSPFLDAESVDEVVARFGAAVDIAQNHRERGWPIGTAIEVFDRDCLERLSARAVDGRVREHVTLYAYERPDEFSSNWVAPSPAVRAPLLSLVVDSAEDLAWVRRIQGRLSRLDASLAEVVAAAHAEAL